MPAQVAERTRSSSAIIATATRATVVCLALCAVLSGSAQALTSATITPTLAPDRLGAKAALTFTIRYAGGEFGVPSPVRRSVLRFPAGLSLDVPSLRSCTTARLRARGTSGCPAQSQIGAGRALVEVHAGTFLLTEEVTLRAFLGPPRNLQPTFEILAEGHSPLEERMVFTGMALPDRAPYGEELVLSIPPIPTLPLEPDASILTFSLTIGASGRPRGNDVNRVLVPSRCPAGGFPFAAAFTYSDGSEGSALATVSCARRAAPPALAARTIALNESARLHLTGKHGFTLDERGAASGTVPGAIYVHLTAVSTSRVTAEVNIYPSGGSLSGYATASYLRGSATASFSGSMSIARGTGIYDHAHGSGLSFSGTIQRSNDAVTVHVRGRVSA